MQKLKAIPAHHLVELEQAQAYYWAVAFTGEKIPYYFMPKVSLYIIVFDLFSYDHQGTVQAQMITAPTVELLYQGYRDVLQQGADYFHKKNATTQL